MDERRFWEIIALFDWDESGDDDAVIEPAIAALKADGQDAIFDFAELLAQRLYALDTREHAKTCFAGESDDYGRDIVSADDFLYGRCAAVANGEETYASVLADPIEMPQGLEFEPLLWIAPTAFERATGDFYDYVTAVSYESFENARGWSEE